MSTNDQKVRGVFENVPIFKSMGGPSIRVCLGQKHESKEMFEKSHFWQLAPQKTEKNNFGPKTLIRNV